MTALFVYLFFFLVGMLVSKLGKSRVLSVTFLILLPFVAIIAYDKVLFDFIHESRKGWQLFGVLYFTFCIPSSLSSVSGYMLHAKMTEKEKLV